MALTFDELENNPFYTSLETKFSEKLKEAQKKLWLICVPFHKSLKGVTITKEFVDIHVLKPSPFFKSHFVTTDINNPLSFEIEDDSIKTQTGTIKILAEETAYNDDYKPYRILITETPLCSSNVKKMAVKGTKMRVATGDADTYIVRSGLEKATSHPKGKTWT
ncbi:hypothetical protein AVEN_115258-1 [Araneus ventricosus]|uniref:Uncharacterized protein n=1 Tax=Araneus ventricosus TaxID=182803 RepID=A0A4Y1ZXT3_ARAVE|nr:hypothetical protein AVEN_115258-1 [Araneus ventricosus]